MTSTRARERLRQEQEVFELTKLHAARWFTLRLTMGYAVIGLLVLISLVAGYVLLHPEGYSSSTIMAAATALLADMLGLCISIFNGLSLKAPGAPNPGNTQTGVPSGDREFVRISSARTHSWSMARLRQRSRSGAMIGSEEVKPLS